MKGKTDLIVVGGGAAGLLCAGVAARRGRTVRVLEKMDRPGRKLLITGKGRCNLCNACERDEFIAAVRRNGRFLYSAYSAFGSRDVMALFEELGVPLKVERGNRVFPASDRAADIVDALVGYARTERSEIVRAAADKLLIEDGRVAGVRCEGGEDYRADSVVLATGGMSYPRTGSTGDGYRLAGQAGHAVSAPHPSLVPIETREGWCRDAMGLSLRNVTLSLYNKQGGKAVYSELGEMLFTHFGVSGPLVLSASAHMEGSPGDYLLRIDLKPGLRFEQLDARLLRDFEANPNRDFINSLGALLPRKLIGPVVKLSGIPGSAKIHQITRGQRQGLAGLLKGLELHPERLRPIDEAVVTRGGVKTAEVDPKTMGSKLAEGLYFAGELLDLDAYTGGFNLQIAFSTGYLAGMNA